MDLTSIFGALTSGPAGAIFGGITGLVGTATTAVMTYKNQKLKNEHDIKMAGETRLNVASDKEFMQAEGKLSMQKAALSAGIEEDKTDGQTLLKSMEGANKLLFKSSYMKTLPGWLASPIAFLFSLVDILKASIRPVLTYYFIYEVVIMAGPVLQGATYTAAMASQIIFTFTYLMVTTVTWWFGDRRMAKHLMRLNDGNSKG